MKPGARALGIAESYRERRSTLAGVVVRRDRVVDGLAFGRCTVGGLDATDAIQTILETLDREDLQVVFVAGIAPAWYNLVDLHRVSSASPCPVIGVTFEAGDDLEPVLQETFDGEELSTRVDIYRSLPEPRAVTVDGETLFVRGVGIGGEHAAETVRAFTPEGGRPEPLRVARLAARAGDALVRGT